MLYYYYNVCKIWYRDIYSKICIHFISYLIRHGKYDYNLSIYYVYVYYIGLEKAGIDLKYFNFFIVSWHHKL